MPGWEDVTEVAGFLHSVRCVSQGARLVVTREFQEGAISSWPGDSRGTLEEAGETCHTSRSGASPAEPGTDSSRGPSTQVPLLAPEELLKIHFT